MSPIPTSASPESQTDDASNGSNFTSTPNGSLPSTGRTFSLYPLPSTTSVSLGLKSNQMQHCEKPNISIYERAAVAAMNRRSLMSILFDGNRSVSGAKISRNATLKLANEVSSKCQNSLLSGTNSELQQPSRKRELSSLSDIPKRSVRWNDQCGTDQQQHALPQSEETSRKRRRYQRRNSKVASMLFPSSTASLLSDLPCEESSSPPASSNAEASSPSAIKTFSESHLKKCLVKLDDNGKERGKENQTPKLDSKEEYDRRKGKGSVADVDIAASLVETLRERASQTRKDTRAAISA